MKICFVQQAYRIQFGIMYLSAICKSKGIDTDVYIYNHDKILPEADIYAVSSSTVSYKEDLRIIKRIKRLTHKPIIIGGPHPTYYSKEVAKEDCIDSIVIGEGYEAIIEYAQGNRKTIYHPREIFDINNLPMPDYGLYYSKYDLKNSLTKSVYIVRGCSFKCSFCYNPAYNALYNGKGKTIQCMDVKKAISEIKELKKKWGFKWLQFMSDTMNMNKEWFIKLLKEYKKQIGGKYICNVRANLVDEELVKVMAYTGCDRVDFGVEHGDETIRNKILKRNMSDNQMINAGRLFKKYGIRVQTTNIFCLPTENINKAIKTVKLNQKIKPEIAKACILQPFENTEIYQYAKDFNILKNTDIISGTTYQRDYDGRDGVSKIVIEDEKKIIRLSYLLDWFVQRPYFNWAIKLIVSLPIDSIIKGYYNSLFRKQEKKYTRSK